MGTPKYYIGHHLVQNYMGEHFPFTPEEAAFKDSKSFSAFKNIWSCAIPPEVYKYSEAVVRLGDRMIGDWRI